MDIFSHQFLVISYLKARKAAVLFVFIFSVFSCNSHSALKHPPSNIIPEDKMKPVLQDIFLADALVQEKHVPPDSLNYVSNQLYADIFAKYHIKSADFYRSMEFYVLHPEIMEKPMEAVVDSLSATEGRSH